MKNQFCRILAMAAVIAGQQAIAEPVVMSRAGEPLVINWPMLMPANESLPEVLIVSPAAYDEAGLELPAALANANVGSFRLGDVVYVTITSPLPIWVSPLSLLVELHTQTSSSKLSFSLPVPGGLISEPR